MKKMFFVLSLVAIAVDAHSDSIMDALKNHKKSLSSNESTLVSVKIPSSTSTATSDNIICDKDQTSLPLSFLTSLILDQNDDLKFAHDNKTKTLTISSPSNMISNCSNMLQWNLNTKKINGKTVHAIEAKFKGTSDCIESGCKYSVAFKSIGEPKFEEHYFEPSLKGFEDCLRKTMVVSDGKINSSAIHPVPLKVTLTIPDESGMLYFQTTGKMSSYYQPKYSESYSHIEGCDYYEPAHPQVRSLVTEKDAEKESLDKTAEELINCNDYSKVVDFIKKYEDYADQLGDIAERLLLESAKKSALAIKSGKYKDEDLKVIEDFNQMVVEPKIKHAKILHDEWLKSDGEIKKNKKSELDKALNEISSLGREPYFLSVHTNKLVSDGKFDEAEKLNTMKLMIQHHQRLGAKENNVVITPEVASERVIKNQLLFSNHLEREKERYDYRTGQSSGKADYYADLRDRMNENIKIRTENYKDEIQAEYERIQPPAGYCYRYFRNTQKCIHDSQERIKELVSLLQHYNNVDKERYEEYDSLAKEWGELEQEGRRYIAVQNGEEPPLESKTYILTGNDETTEPPVRKEPQRNDVYNFDFNPGNQQNPQHYHQNSQMTPHQSTYPVSPYQTNNMFMQQNPYSYYNQSYLGQQSFSPYYQNTYQQPGIYNFNWNNSWNSMQQPGQLPYWNQPHQAYANFQMYR